MNNYPVYVGFLIAFHLPQLYTQHEEISTYTARVPTKFQLPSGVEMKHDDCE
jgi:hypothetical protein